MPDGEDRPVERDFVSIAEVLVSSLKAQANVLQQRDNAAYDPIAVLQVAAEFAKEIKRGEFSLDDVERVVRKETSPLANQQSVCDLKKAFDETFGWLRRIVQMVKKIPNWILWIATVFTIVQFFGGDVNYLWSKIKPLFDS